MRVYKVMNRNRIYRLVVIILLSNLAFSSVPAQVRLAAWGGIHTSNFIQKNDFPGFDTSRGQYYSSSTGFELGVLGEIAFGKNNLFFQPGILYSAKGNQFQRYYDSSIYQNDTLYNQHTLNLNYVVLPLYVTWKIPFSKNHKNNFYISAGPYFAFIYGATESYQYRVKQYNTSKYIYQSGTEDQPVGTGIGKYKTYDIGLTAKAGFELGSVMIGAYYSQGLTNAYTAAYPSSFHNQVYGASLGIWLNKPKPEIKDTDNDGTPDPEDSCVTIPGPPHWHGCPIPDSDLDGINDEQDSCKNLPGIARYHGCPIPDSDDDGINDEMDSCKLVPGLAKYHGCPIPDTDQDGINDDQDSCKLVPGVAKYHGCPVPDRDKDGVADELDKCPDQPGPASNLGCPVLRPELVRRARQVTASVLFDMNSAKLTKSSYPALNELADSLKANPHLDLLIEGHTDNIGNSAYNLKLSEERAESVKKTLVSQGISESRIRVKGFGDTQPIASNESFDGRAANRRVVFVFQLKNR